VKKILIYFCIFFGLVVLIVSTNKELMGRISFEREYEAPKGAWWAAYMPDAGDLAAMSYLSGQKKFAAPKDYAFPKPVDTGKKNVDLYIYGDSYLMEVPGSAFVGIDSYYYARRGYNDIDFDLDTTKKNILIVEVGERFMRDYFTGVYIFNNVREKHPKVSFYQAKEKQNNYAAFATVGTTDLDRDTFSLDSLFVPVNKLFNKNINQNLEFNLFNYPFINPVRMAKAQLNYQWFKRASGAVTISENGEYLFLTEVMAKTGTPSSYNQVTEEQLFNIVNNINTIYDSYTQRGFDMVYISIIPNPSTVLQPEGYNGLIPKIQKHPGMKVPSIDMYGALKQVKAPQQYYRMGDTHWNNNGVHLWLSLVNAEVRKWNYPELNNK
jgi:hypothetical protein